jgi:hypothetical protein
MFVLTKQQSIQVINTSLQQANLLSKVNIVNSLLLVYQILEHLQKNYFFEMASLSYSN